MSYKNKSLLTQALLFIGILLVLGCILVGLIVKLFFPNVEFIASSNFSNTISPVIGLIGAALVYYSFVEQQKANQLQFDALNIEKERNNNTNKFNQLINMMNDMENMFSEFPNIEYNSGVEIAGKGISGMQSFLRHISKIADNPPERIENRYYDLEPHSDTLSYYLSFLRVVKFVAQGIIDYPRTEDHSRDVLMIKFDNINSKFLDMVDMIGNEAHRIDKKTFRLFRLDVKSSEIFNLCESVHFLPLKPKT